MRRNPPEELGFTSMHDHTIYDFEYVEQGFGGMYPDMTGNVSAYDNGADILAETERRKAMHFEIPEAKSQEGIPFMTLLDGNPASKLSDVEYYANELKQFKLFGGQSLCDDSAIDFFRPNLSKVQELSRRSGINIISCAGFYANSTISDEWLTRGEDAMTQYLETIIVDGDETCGARPGFMKCAANTIQNGTLAPKEMMALRACARMAKKYGMSLHVHTTGLIREATILNLADMLEYEFHLNPSRVVFCHIDTVCIGFFNPSVKINKHGYSTELPLALMKRGFNIGLDTWSMNSDDENIFLYTVEMRKKLLAALVDAGYAEHITLGHDMMRKTVGFQNRGGGYTVFERALREMVMDNQITEDTVHTITVKNPARILTIEE